MIIIEEFGSQGWKSFRNMSTTKGWEISQEWKRVIWKFHLFHWLDKESVFLPNHCFQLFMEIRKLSNNLPSNLSTVCFRISLLNHCSFFFISKPNIVVSLYLAFAIPRFPTSPTCRCYKIKYMHQRYQMWLRNCFIQSVELGLSKTILMVTLTDFSWGKLFWLWILIICFVILSLITSNWILI